MRASEFKTFHPVVSFIYFVAVIGFSMTLMHPVCLLISLMAGFSYSVLLNGKKAIKTNLLYMIPVVLVTALLNPLFNHQGATVITYFSNGNPMTAESIIYGFCAAVMVVSVICWFSCYNEIMTSDKFIYLFGRVIPALSLVISMTLRFVPRFIRQMKQISDAQKTAGNKKGKIKSAISVISSVVTWSLENAMDTSDSMRARGYGLPGRTAFSVFKFDARDFVLLLALVIMLVYVIAGYITEAVYVSFFPVIFYGDVTFYSVSVIVMYAAFYFAPVIIELWEVRKWKYLISKI